MLVIISLKTAIITVLAVVSTYLCRRFGIIAEFPMSLIATVVVFPIVFRLAGHTRGGFHPRAIMYSNN